jgi:hypothetical protein
MTPNNVKTDADRGLATLTKVFRALPDLMNSMDRAFLVRFGIHGLTADDMEALARVQREADVLEPELVAMATKRHENEGNDATTAHRLAVAEFAGIFISGVNSLCEGGRS